MWIYHSSDDYDLIKRLQYLRNIEGPHGMGPNQTRNAILAIVYSQ